METDFLLLLFSFMIHLHIKFYSVYQIHYDIVLAANALSMIGNI